MYVDYFFLDGPSPHLILPSPAFSHVRGFKSLFSHQCVNPDSAPGNKVRTIFVLYLNVHPSFFLHAMYLRLGYNRIFHQHMPWISGISPMDSMAFGFCEDCQEPERKRNLMAVILSCNGLLHQTCHYISPHRTMCGVDQG
jgi:hypothetical protein